MKTGAAAVAVAERLLDPGIVLSAVPDGGAATLSDGLPGTALLHARLARLDPRFEHAAVEHWARAAEEATRSPRAGGAYGVLGGLAASLIIGSPYLADPGVNQKSVARAVRWTSAYAVNLAEQQASHLRYGGSGTPWHIYDVINGLAGLGRVLLAALVGGHTTAEPGLHAALSTLTTMLTAHDGTRPGWWAGPSQHPPKVATRIGPSGAATTGMAHGVAGPMALLARALSADVTVPGQANAVRHAVRWLNRWRTAHGWPTELTGDELDTGHAAARGGRQTAWCYGTPGIGNALFHAGQALGDAPVTGTARTAFSCLPKHPEAWDTEGPTLCHGHAGVMRCATDVDHAVADAAAAAVRGAFGPSRPFGFAHHEDGRQHNVPGFLTGAAGVALALAEHAHLPAAPVNTRWDALLLVS